MAILMNNDGIGDGCNYCGGDGSGCFGFSADGVGEYSFAAVMYLPHYHRQQN